MSDAFCVECVSIAVFLQQYANEYWFPVLKRSSPDAVKGSISQMLFSGPTPPASGCKASETTSLPNGFFFGLFDCLFAFFPLCWGLNLH